MRPSRQHAYSTEAIEGMLKPRVEDLCRLLAADGKRIGHEWVARNPTRADGKPGSFSINLHTGKWSDFAAGDASSIAHPVLSLICYLQIRRDGGEAFGEAIKWAKDYLGLTGRAPDPAKLAAINEEVARRQTQAQIEEDRAIERKRKAANAIWLEGAGLSGHCPASEYLAARGIDIHLLPEIPGALRFSTTVKIATITGKPHSAMVAAMSKAGVPNGFAAVHATYIAPHDEGWRKAFGKDSKKILGSPSGAAIRLTKGASGKPLEKAPAGEWLAVGEGIENCLSFALFNPTLRVLAAGTVGNLGKVKLPDQIGGVKVIADNDKPGSPANMVLENACNALVDRGLDIEIYQPPSGFKDFNDALLQLGAPRTPSMASA